MTGYVTVVSDERDIVGYGKDLTTRSAGVLRSESSIDVWAGYGLHFRAPGGEALRLGHYDDARSWAEWTTGYPLIVVSGDGSCWGRGSFVILENSADRLWVRFRYGCEKSTAGRDDQIFGEIRLGYEDDEEQLQVEARQIDFPPALARQTYPNGFPVRVTNNGPDTAVVQADVVAGSNDFTVTDNDCPESLDPAASCSFNVAFVPSRGGPVRGLLTVSDGRGGTKEVNLSGTGIGGRTSWHLRGDPDDRLTGGETFDFSQSSVHVRGGARGITAGAGSWEVWVTAPYGEDLEIGRAYRTDWTFATENNRSPGLYLEGRSQSCMLNSGTFTVHEATFNPEGEMTSFHLTFESHCDRAEPAARGEVHWRTSDPAAPTPDTIAPEPVGNVLSVQHGSGAELSWTNPPDSDWVDTVILGASGPTAPSAGEGTLIYQGRRESARVTGVLTWEPYSLSLFSQDSSGNLSARETLTIAATTESPPPTPPSTPAEPGGDAPSHAPPTPSAIPSPPGLATDADESTGRVGRLVVTRRTSDRVLVKVRAGEWATRAQVVLLRRTPSGWMAVARTRLSRAGRMTWHLDATSKRHARIRVRVRTDEAAMTSAPLRIPGRVGASTSTALQR